MFFESFLKPQTNKHTNNRKLLVFTYFFDRKDFRNNGALNAKSEKDKNLKKKSRTKKENNN